MRNKSLNFIGLTLAFALLILAIDQISKYLTQEYLPLMNHAYYSYPYGGVAIFKDFLGIEFSISYTINKGAAWGLLGNYQFLLVVMRITLIFALLLYTLLANLSRTSFFFFTLIITGAIGNVIDYFVYGQVIDMLHVVLWGYDFPVFNVADSAISIGVVSLLLISIFAKPDNSPTLMTEDPKEPGP